ncbi:MAG: GyrI-like domain-containing protein [Defluviitaleaceae bacterium]|nr:GyrI-like domain-containing protein [Defluviitaleaceae bacterium]
MMNLRFEKRTTFYVSGYGMETREESLEKDCATLRAQYEDKLRSISDHLYFVAWMKNESENIMIYHLGVEAPSQTPVTEGATCVEVPGAKFAVATVPEGEPILATWHKFFATGLSSLGADMDMNYPINFESFDENGVCELWIPVKED